MSQVQPHEKKHCNPKVGISPYLVLSQIPVEQDGKRRERSFNLEERVDFMGEGIVRPNKVELVRLIVKQAKLYRRKHSFDL